MFITDFDLNLPLDEFGAVDMDFIENMTGICCNSCPCLYLIELSLDIIVRQHFFVEQDAPVLENRNRREMSGELKKQVYQALLARSNNGTPQKKDTQIVADQFDLHIRTVQCVWKEVNNN
jgi:hypothetical protein